MNDDAIKSFHVFWDDDASHEWIIKTSGSTGNQKEIILHKQWMKWSAMNTAKFLSVNTSDKILCCLPLNKVGGIMQLVRAKVWGVDIEIAEPGLNPLLKDTNATVCSFTPQQLHYILNEKESRLRFNKLKKVLIGGADINPRLLNELKSEEFEDVSIFHTYGMTETYSHIAYKEIKKDGYFTCFDEVNIRQGESGEAILNVPFYNQELVTTDVVNCLNSREFEVLGRLDFVINTGGLKFHPEWIESLIYKEMNLKENMAISSKKDEVLGNRIVLVHDSKINITTEDLYFLKKINPYIVPKEIICIDEIPMNEGGKVDRLKINKLIND
jgi:O-succinylbenzoic acid--CoA ligase